MAAMTPNQIGRHAELITAELLSRPVGPPFRRPLLRVVFLGDKYPTADFLVDILDPSDNSCGFCFLQVKGTTGGSTTATRMKADVPVDKFNRLCRLPAPAYLLAVDLFTRDAYLTAACRVRTTSVSSVTKKFPISQDSVKIGLYREVLNFWTIRKALRRVSGFKDD
jgi:hypothetical protein